MATKRIKRSITEKEYKILIAHVKGDESLKAFNQERFLRIFSLLYYSGVRVNELSQIRYKHMREIFTTGETVIISHKTKTQRILYFSNPAIKDMKRYFNTQEDEHSYIISSWNNPRNRMHEISLINVVNKYLKKVLGDGFTSHSFRQGLITQMGSSSVNVKIIQKFIGHSSVKTTLLYIKPTAQDVKRALVR